jgi:hypothetical protein
MKKIVLAVSLLTLSQMVQAGNWNNSSSLKINKSTISDTIAPENFLLPAEVMFKFKNVPLDIKKKFCSANPKSNNHFQNIKPVDRIKGFNSRMDNGKNVEGANASNEFARGASVILTSLWALEDDSKKELAFNTLYKWAEADAWGKTVRCFLNDSCGKYWARSDGQDPFAGHDDNQSALYVLHIGYAYYVTFGDYLPDDDRHVTIKKWINKWVKTRMKVFDNFGNDLGWRLPDIFANTSKGKVNKNQIVELLNFIDENLLDDGSIKNRTTRGNRSLWYHHASMAEIMIGLEIANSHGVKIPQSLLTKIEKAANIFVAGFKDPHKMHQWAKKKYNSQYAGSGDIIFKDNLNNATGKSWLYTFMYRFPDSPVSIEIAKLMVGGERVAVKDSYIGFGLGCVYGSLTYDPATVKIVKVEVSPIIKERQLDNRKEFTSYKIELADRTKLYVMVDWWRGDVQNVRLKINTYELNIKNEKAILACNKGGTVIRNGKLTAIKVSLGVDSIKNSCVFKGLADETVEKLETMIHSSHAIFAQSKIVPETINNFVKLN